MTRCRSEWNERERVINMLIEQFSNRSCGAHVDIEENRYIIDLIPEVRGEADEQEVLCMLCGRWSSETRYRTSILHEGSMWVRINGYEAQARLSVCRQCIEEKRWFILEIGRKKK